MQLSRAILLVFVASFFCGTQADARRTNGVCGSANGQKLLMSTPATASLCAAGTASPVAGSGPWSWSCAGSSGGANATCSAQKAPHVLTVGMSEDAYIGDAKYSLSVDGAQITGTVTALHSSGASQEISVGANANSSHQILVTFLNDAWGGTPSTDRNLYVNYVKYDGVDQHVTPTVLYTTGAAFSVSVPVVVPPPPPPGVPPPAAAAGFNTQALNSDFTQPQPAGWFGCMLNGGASNATWYAALEGGDNNTQGNPHPDVPCSTTGGETRYNLVTDPLIGKQVLDLTFKTSDILEQPNVWERHYTSLMNVDGSNHYNNPSAPWYGITFPSNMYTEATFRIQPTPALPGGAGASPNEAGLWWGFWQSGAGVNPINGSWNGIEVDNPELHGENQDLQSDCVINWWGGDGGFCTNPTWATGHDWSGYHTWGMRSVTDGSSKEQYCFYIDGVQFVCQSTAFGTPAQYSERKALILFAGLHCLYTNNQSQCINLSISSISNCGDGTICVKFTQPVTISNPWPLYFVFSGVTGAGAANVNGVQQVNMHGDSSTWQILNSSFTGAPAGGVANTVSQIDMLIQRVSLWSCASWQTTNCNVSSFPQ